MLGTTACAADTIAGPQVAPEPESRPSAELGTAPRQEPARDAGPRLSVADIVTRGREPLWVVDGVITMTQPRLHPSDIASLEVLTDAQVSCCSRCPELVILVTTRGGAR